MMQKLNEWSHKCNKTVLITINDVISGILPPFYYYSINSIDLLKLFLK